MYLFEYLGAFYKWLFFSLLSYLLGKERPVFRNMLHPLDENTDVMDSLAGGASNKIIGFIVTMIICSILVKF